jgi:hypothetical protein
VWSRVGWVPLALVALVVGGLSPAAASLGPRIAILSFDNEAGFEGRWTLSDDVPRALGTHLTSLSSLQVIDADSVTVAEDIAREAGERQLSLAIAVGQALDADYVLRGVVTKCGIRRVVAGDPNLGGYRSFTYSIGVDEVELTRTTTGAVVRTLSVVRDSVMRPLELNLFGRPTAHDRELDTLREIDFDSEAFEELAFGRFVHRALDEMAVDIVGTIYDRRPLVLSREGARVLAVDEEQIFLGIGVDDYLEAGDVVPILDAQGERVALVEVAEIIGPHLSSAIPLPATVGSTPQAIEVGFRIGQRLAPDVIPQD